MSWDDIKKEESAKFKTVVKKVDKLKDDKIPEVLDEALKYYNIEKTKKLSDRKVFEDKFGGHIILVRFPKKSILDKVKNVKNWTPKPTKNDDAIRWYGATMPLFNDDIVTLFLSEEFFPIIKERQTTFEDFWEPENVTRLFVIRGTDNKEYKWLDEEKDSKIYSRKETDFLKEAKTIEKYKDIKNVSEINIGELGKIKHTFNTNQLLKVI